MLDRWRSTVRVLRDRRDPISTLLKPWATRRSSSSSRPVRTAVVAPPGLSPPAKAVTSARNSGHAGSSARRMWFVLCSGTNHILLADEPAWPEFLAEVTAFAG